MADKQVHHKMEISKLRINLLADRIFDYTSHFYSFLIFLLEASVNVIILKSFNNYCYLMFMFNNIYCYLNSVIY